MPASGWCKRADVYDSFLDDSLGDLGRDAASGRWGLVDSDPVDGRCNHSLGGEAVFVRTYGLASGESNHFWQTIVVRSGPRRAEDFEDGRLVSRELHRSANPLPSYVFPLG